MKKKLIFGLFGFGALLCGSLVSLVSLAPQSKADVKEVRAEDEVPTIKITQEDFIPDNVDTHNRTNFIYFLLKEGTEGHNPEGTDIIPYVSGEANRFFGTNDVKIYNTDGSLKGTYNTNIYKIGTIRGQNGGTQAGKGMYYYSYYYFQIHGWGDVPIEDGETIVFDGTSERKIDGVVDARIIFDNVSFIRRGDYYYCNEELETYTVDKDEISNIHADRLSGDIAIRFNTKNSNNMLVNGAWDLNHNRGYDFVNAVTITPADGEPFTKDVNLIKEDTNRYLILSTSWAGNSYYGDGFALAPGMKLTFSGEMTYKESYELKYTLDFEITILDETGNIMVTGKEPFSVTIDETTISTFNSKHDHIGASNEYFAIEVFTNEDDGVIANSSWAVSYQIADGVTITPKSGDVTTTKAFFIKNGSTKYEFIFSVEGWIGNFYDFQPGDNFRIHGAATGNSDGRVVTFNVDFSYHFRDSIEVDYTNQKTVYSSSRSATQENIYLVFDEYLEEDNLDVKWAYYNDPDGILYTKVTGETETMGADFAKTDYDSHNKACYCFSLPKEWGGQSYRNFETGDRLDFNVETSVDNGTDDLVLKFQFSVWYVKECNTIEGKEGCWVDEATYAPVQEVINKINAIGTVTLESGTAIAQARTAYDALTQRQQYLVLNSNALTGAETELVDLTSAKAFDDQVDAIGEVTLEKEQQIVAARTAYEALTAGGKAFVTKLGVLEDAETRLNELKANKAAAEEVDAKIDAIDEVALDSETAINEARTAYEALNEEAKGMVTKLATLQAAETELARLKGLKAEAEAVDELFDAIPNIMRNNYENDKHLVTEAREAYEALSEEAQGYVTKLYLLQGAEGRVRDIEAAIAVDDLIVAIGEVTLEKEQQIVAARTAYDALTANQNRFVQALGVLQAAEARLAELKVKAAAEEVDAKIESIGTVTLNSEAAINEARAAYEALNEEAKGFVTKLNVLQAAETELARLKGLKAEAEAVDAKIDAIGEVNVLKECREKIEAARTAYDALSEEAKAMVSNYETLTAAEARFAELLLAAKEDGKTMVDNIYASINLKKYSKDNQEIIAQLVEEAKSNIDGAFDADEIDEIISEFEANLNEIPQKKAAAKKGCGGSVIATSVVLSSLALAGLSLLSIKKRKED